MSRSAASGSAKPEASVDLAAGPLAGTARVALLGNPNTGKTTLFNRLCGLRAKTANFPGTTTDARAFSPRFGASKAATGSPKCKSTPLPFNSACSHAAISGSSGIMTCGIASTTVTPKPRRRSCSAISSPI